MPIIQKTHEEMIHYYNFHKIKGLRKKTLIRRIEIMIEENMKYFDEEFPAKNVIFFYFFYFFSLKIKTTLFKINYKINNKKVFSF